MAELHSTDLPRCLLQNVPDAVLVTDMGGKIVLWNPGAESVFGYRAEEALGQTLDLIIPERLRPGHWRGFRQSVDAGSTLNDPKGLLCVPALRRDGSTIACEFSLALLREEDGTVIGMGAILRDVSARRGEEKALRERLAALEQAAAPPRTEEK